MSAFTDQHPALHDLLQCVGAVGMLIGDDMTSYTQGARYGSGRALCVVRPASAAEVCTVVQTCARHRLRMIMQGANTGLVGASTPDATGSQIVLSLSRLRKECHIDVANRSVTIDAGFTLHELNEKLEPHGLWFPIDLGANPTIGGMIAANTGGTRLIRYGDVRHNLLDIDVVLCEPAGQLLHLGSPLRKDNTGFDLKQLFVGTSGVAGVITRATLEVHARPKQTATALVVPVSDDAVTQLLEQLEAELGDFLAAFEGMSANAMNAAVTHIPNLRNPFAPEPIPEFAILIALESNSSPHYTKLDLQEALNLFLQDRFEALLVNAVVGNDQDIWQLRHCITEGARNLGKIIAFDVSVARSHIMPFRRKAIELVQASYPWLRVIDFGHIADGGVHFNVCWPHDAASAYDAAVVAKLRDAVYALVVEEFGGSFSAEHGVGPHNIAYYRKYTSPIAQSLVGHIKTKIDPLSLCGGVDFGPGAVDFTPTLKGQDG